MELKGSLCERLLMKRFCFFLSLLFYGIGSLETAESFSLSISSHPRHKIFLNNTSKGISYLELAVAVGLSPEFLARLLMARGDDPEIRAKPRQEAALRGNHENLEMALRIVDAQKLEMASSPAMILGLAVPAACPAFF